MAKGEVDLPIAGATPILPLLLVGFGGYLAWFAVKYWRQDVTWPSDPVKSVLQGKGLPTGSSATPVHAYLTAEISSAQQSVATAPASTSPATAGTGGITGAVASGVGEIAWINAFLLALGAPPTQANVTSISSWISHEGPYGTQGGNNPLNTTQDEPGATSFAGLAVKNYPTQAEGIQALVTTLNNGRYGDILLYLRSGQGLCGKSLAGLSTWSDGGYSQVC